jgi:CheY-like chemotaxis protein
MPKAILVADDSVTIRKVVELTFHDTGIRVESVGTGREALERIAARPFDLILADVVMPEPTGYEICRTVKGSDHAVPVVLLAGTFEPFDEAEAAGCGADGRVVKPFESRALLDLVERLLSRPAPEPPPPLDRERLAAELDGVLHEAAGVERMLAGDLPVGVEPVDILLGVEPTASSSEALLSVARRETTGLSEEEIERIVVAVVQRMSEKVLREIAWEVVPDLAEAIIRERLRQVEQAEVDRT